MVWGRWGPCRTRLCPPPKLSAMAMPRSWKSSCQADCACLESIPTGLAPCASASRVVGAGWRWQPGRAAAQLGPAWAAATRHLAARRRVDHTPTPPQAPAPSTCSRYNPDIRPGRTIVVTTEQGLHARVRRRADRLLVVRSTTNAGAAAEHTFDLDDEDSLAHVCVKGLNGEGGESCQRGLDGVSPASTGPGVCEGTPQHPRTPGMKKGPGPVGLSADPIPLTHRPLLAVAHT